MAKKAKAYPGGKELAIHNPHKGSGVLFTLGPQKEGTKSMANKKANTKKKGGSKKKKRSNTGTAKASKPKKSNPGPTKKKGGSKSRSSSLAKRMNGLPSLGNVSVTDWAAFVLFAITTRAITSVFVDPDSWKGVGVQIGLTALAARFAPKGVKTAAVFGAGGGAAISAFNKLTNGLVQNTITGWVGRLGPQQQIAAGAGAGAPAQTGMAGQYRGPRRVVRTYR
jgi:hypothetical protein